MLMASGKDSLYGFLILFVCSIHQSPSTEEEMMGIAFHSAAWELAASITLSVQAFTLMPSKLGTSYESNFISWLKSWWDTWVLLLYHLQHPHCPPLMHHIYWWVWAWSRFLTHAIETCWCYYPPCLRGDTRSEKVREVLWLEVLIPQSYCHLNAQKQTQAH